MNGFVEKRTGLCRIKSAGAAAAVLLINAGRLSLNQRLNLYFPGFPNAAQITIEMLLNHTSGVFDITNDQAFMPTARR